VQGLLADAALVVLRFWIAALVRLGEEIASETMRMSAHAVRGEGKFQMVKKKQRCVYRENPSG